MTPWSKDAVFYHIYPIGFCGAPSKNDFVSPPVKRLDKIYGWMEHMQYLGTTALYLGPLFESTSHGYDTVDYYSVDRRLGTNQGLANLIGQLHQRGIHVVLDGVFNHVGRDFFAFKDVQARGEQSDYRDWFYNLRFDQSSPYHDPFSYESWNGHYSLVKLNLQNGAVKEHLFGAARKWIEELDIDGLRLDAADCLDHGFLRDLAGICRSLKPDFWLMGEVVHGDYRQWASPVDLDSVTNYECYKGLYSSFNEKNFFEIAYSLNRQSGESGMYRGLDLYTFVDNHDVSRIASMIKNPAHLIPLYTLLFTMPGIPSVYYGSEFGIEGKKTNSDLALRPNLDLGYLNANNPRSDLTQAIQRLSMLRQEQSVFRQGDYRQVHVAPQLFAFCRQFGEDWALVVINAAGQAVELSLRWPFSPGARLVDLLNEGEGIQRQEDQIRLAIPGYGARVVIAE